MTSEKSILARANDGIITLRPSPEALEAFEMWRTSSKKDQMSKTTFEKTKAIIEAGVPNVMPDMPIIHDLNHFTCAGSEVYTLSPTTPSDSNSNIVLFIHGGAWVMPLAECHLAFCDKLVDAMEAQVYMPLYPLGPKHSYKDTYNMLLQLYKKLLELGKPIYIMGDSAGGQISLSLATIIRDEGLRGPENIAALSPCADFTFSNPKIKELEKVDPRLAIYGTAECAKMWMHDANPADPLLSLNYADLRGLPDVLMVVETKDILYPDCMILHERLKAAGCKTLLVVGEGMGHIFFLDDVPERAITLQIIREFCLGI